MPREEILQAIEDLTAQIRTLSYSSSKEAAAQRADLQQRRRDSTRPVRGDTLMVVCSGYV